ncbi:iron ABC transporter permease [Desulfosarcina ovata subsp. sediminis]|uniref:Iron ABC transporter permease n=1 Tax=Desulfosarcina ovata subsp. sediminis TaxID=885957 RepID=A0A5K8A091_9BACT|nr:iron ABC transporter permease [Desulfosarcina ovata]BBO85932.1 iron ABC transporter permease [Desulfosarcina ovata subsp. sediminis]
MKHRLRLLLALPPLIFLGIFYFYPLASILITSFTPENGAWAPGGLGRLVDSGYYAGVLWFTTWQAALSTLLTLLVALPGAYVFARFDFRGKALIQSMTAVPFVLPTVVTAAAFKALLGPGGLANQALMALFELNRPPIRIDHTVWFFLLAHIFYNYTVVLRIVGGFWARLSGELADAARMLGASGQKVFFTITLPLIMPAITAAAMLVFVFCFTSFGVVLILGGPRLATVEVEIYRQAVHLFNLPMAAALSMVQIVFTFALMGLYTWFERRSAVSLMPQAATGGLRRPHTRRERLVIGWNLTVMLLLLGTPLLALCLGSVLTEAGPALTYYRSLLENPTGSIMFVSPLAAMRNSLGFALAATLIALFIGWFSAAFLAGAKHRAAGIIDPLFMLPLSTSAVTLGFGFIIALDEPPLNLRTALLLPAVAHALVAFPFVIRSLLPAWRSIPRHLREAATMLGASPFRVWRHVDWPILRRALWVGAIFAFAISMGEFGATVFVARPRTPTLPLAIYRYLNQPGALNIGRAMAMSCLLMLTTSAGFLFIEKFRSIGGEF